MVLAVLALVLAVAWRGHWRVQLLTGVIAALVVVGVLALVGRSLTGVEDSFPASFYLWLGLVTTSPIWKPAAAAALPTS